MDAMPATDQELEPAPPFSGIAIAAFVLSFITGFFALAGPWYVTLFPIALGALAIVGIRKSGKRGHLLAVFAIGVALLFGGFAYFMHSKGREAFLAVPRGVVAVLADASKDAAAKDEALKAWAYAEALEADPALTTGWREAFERMVSEYGPVQGPVEPGDHVPGFMVMIVPPPGHGDEIHPTTDANPPSPGKGIWVRLPFEKATVWLCVVVGMADDDGREAAGRIQEDAPSPVVGAMRYFLLE